MRMLGSSIAVLSFLCATARAEAVLVSLPERAACDPEQVVSALQARLPQSEIRSGESTSATDVRLKLSHAMGRWEVEILAPGQGLLSRPLWAQEGDCVAISEAAALIAERYLVSIQWVIAPAEVRALPPPPPPGRWQASLALSGGAALGLTGAAPMGALEVGVRWSGWALELSGAYLGFGQIALVTSTLPAYEFHHTAAVSLTVGRRFAFGPGAVHLGLTPGLELDWVGSSASSATSTPNPLPHHQVVLATLPFAGAQARYELNLTSKLTVGLRVQARVHLGTRTFVAEGYMQSLVTHPVDGDVSLVVSYVFF